MDAQVDALKWRAALEELTIAGRILLDGLHQRIEMAPSTAKPVFHGIVELHDALSRADKALVEPTR